MADTYKVLGRIAPTNTNAQVLYTVPTGKTAIISSILTTNTTTSDKTFSLYSLDSEPNVSPVPAFVVFDDDNWSGFAYTTDGMNWYNQRTAAYCQNIVQVGNALILETNDGLRYSTDMGATVATLVDPNFTTGTWDRRVRLIDNKFFTFSWDNAAMAALSTDGLSWTPVTQGPWDPNSGIYYRSIAVVSTNIGAYVIAYDDSIGEPFCWNTTDGVNWDNANAVLPNNIWGMFDYDSVYNNKRYFKSINNVIFSVDGNSGSGFVDYSTDNGVTWGTMDFSGIFDGDTGYTFTYANGKFIFVSSTYGGLTYYTDDFGDTFNSIDNGGATDWPASLGYIGGNYTLSKDYNNAIYSTDLITWNNYVSSIKTDSNDVNNDWTPYSTYIVQPYLPPDNKAIYKESILSANSIESLEPGIILSSGESLLAKTATGVTLTIFGVES